VIQNTPSGGSVAHNFPFPIVVRLVASNRVSPSRLRSAIQVGGVAHCRWGKSLDSETEHLPFAGHEGRGDLVVSYTVNNMAKNEGVRRITQNRLP
jgi:hypothetical protein